MLLLILTLFVIPGGYQTLIFPYQIIHFAQQNASNVESMPYLGLLEEWLYYLPLLLFVLFGGTKALFKFYEARGHAHPDTPDQKDFPIITSPEDASAHWVIDQSKKQDE